MNVRDRLGSLLAPSLLAGTGRPMPDVLIVGGSLAGAATAIHLARAGRSVLLLERSQGYRRKACGEGLSPRGVAELDRLGEEA
jgi:flavin-dependent dehydrogenase